MLGSNGNWLVAAAAVEGESALVGLVGDVRPAMLAAIPAAFAACVAVPDVDEDPAMV